MLYNWQQPDWPNFRYDIAGLDDALLAFASESGYGSGIVKTLPHDMQVEAIIDLMVAEAIKTSEIEGEYLSRKDVKSSIRNKMGLNKPLLPVKDKVSQGAGELMVEVRNTYALPLTEEMIFSWHKTLFNQSSRIKIGTSRTHEEPMQVISGAIGKEKVHFEAPPSSKVKQEMIQLITWFNETAPNGKRPIKKALLRAAVTHLYFETIHPFEDGNGRIGRALAEKALSQTSGFPVLLSLSRTIEVGKKDYYDALEQAQKSNEITGWVSYFADVVVQAQKEANGLIDFMLKKTRFFDRYKNVINERQLKVVQRMFDEGPDGFQGGMSAKKYSAITKASKATATRDMQVLLKIGVFKVEGGGRSIHYNLNLE